MRIAYANAFYKLGDAGGGNAHVRQFIENGIALGHEIWAWPGNQHPAVHPLPSSNLGLAKTLRQMDALYVRIERTPPSPCRWAVPPHRLIYGFPVVVWEFNTIPEYGLLRGRSERDVQTAIDGFRTYGRGCDLAICMTDTLADYVRDNFRIQRILIVPNGSDPDLFHPDVSPVSRLSPFTDKFNVLWMGSADISWNDFAMLRETAQLLWHRSDGQNIAFHIVGAGLIGMMGSMPPNVHYWGAEYYNELPHWLAAMHVGVSLYKLGPADHATPLKIFDYMASGLAVVSTSQPFLIDLFDQLKQPELLVQPGDVRRLADVLIDLASDPAKVKRQGLAGRQLVIERYNWRRAVVDTFTEIDQILHEKKRDERH